MDSEEEALFRNSHYPLYFVQSPSTIELSRHNNNNNNSNNNNNNSNDFSSVCHSPIPRSEADPLALSRYSSSRGSNHSFSHHEKKISCDSLQSHDTRIDENIEIDQEKHCGAVLLVHHGKNGGSGREEGDEYEEETDYYYENGNWKRFFSLGYSDSTPWIVLQVTWRLIVSMIVALVVFYIATKPPAPKVSLKITGVREFGLREGVDGTGVNTKMLTCNCSMSLQIDNKSKLFGLYMHPPAMEMYFVRLPLILAQGEELYAGSYVPTYFKLNVGTRDKALYGAGRIMQDMLQSNKGLPLLIRVHLSSTFHVVWGLIKPKFHHQIECLVVLHNTYNKRHRTQVYNSTCVLTPS